MQKQLLVGEGDFKNMPLPCPKSWIIHYKWRIGSIINPESGTVAGDGGGGAEIWTIHCKSYSDQRVLTSQGIHQINNQLLNHFLQNISFPLIKQLILYTAAEAANAVGPCFWPPPQLLNPLMTLDSRWISVSFTIDSFKTRSRSDENHLLAIPVATKFVSDESA